MTPREKHEITHQDGNDQQSHHDENTKTSSLDDELELLFPSAISLSAGFSLSGWGNSHCGSNNRFHTQPAVRLARIENNGQTGNNNDDDDCSSFGEWSDSDDDSDDGEDGNDFDGIPAASVHSLEAAVTVSAACPVLLASVEPWKPAVCEHKPRRVSFSARLEEVRCFEKWPLEDYSRLYYSCHELQKMQEEQRASSLAELSAGTALCL